MNPLINEFNTQYKTVPFLLIKNEHYLPALKASIDNCMNEIKSLKEADTTKVNFNNFIAKLIDFDKDVSKVSNVFFNQLSVNTNDELQEIAKEFSPIITKFYNDLMLDSDIFKNVKAVYERGETLETEEAKILDEAYQNYIKNGALCNEEDKNKLRAIDEKLGELGLLFGENLLAQTNKFEMVITNEDDLEGLPETIRTAAKEEAIEREMTDSWVFTLHYPSYGPFMTYSKNRELRKKMYKAYGSKAFNNGENDNQKNILEIVKLRKERSNLLGKKDHAEYILESRMAKNKETVFKFIDDLKEKAMPKAVDEIKELEAFAKADSIDKLEKWDVSYYVEKLKMEKFKFDDEMLRPYFKLENVIDGVFNVASKLFGIRFEVIDDIDKYHEDVKTYKVLDESGDDLGIFYADFHPRKSKQGGAWMTNYILQSEKQRPHVAIVCNFSKSTSENPSLLTFNEVQTLFHEFGHSLHGLLSKCKYEYLSGTSVYWDFVELPSQILENWCYEKECLDLFAKDYKTGELISDTLLKNLKDSSTFFEANGIIRQLNLATLDMKWHSANEEIRDVKKFEDMVTKPFSMFESDSDTCTSCSFSHIFSGGYSAGYYSYKWAEVLDADAFEYFKTSGIFNKEIASKFRTNILEKGGTEDPMKLYKDFRGSTPSVEPLLRRSGLV